MDQAAQIDVTQTEADRICRDNLSLPVEYTPPGNEVETALAEIWRNVLSIDLVGVGDNFFDLGGDSFSAAAIATQIEESFSIAFPVSLLMDYATVAELAAYVAEVRREGSTSSNIAVAARPDGSRPPLFLVHGAHGMIFLRPDFFKDLDPEIPVYVFYAKGFDGQDTPNETVEDIAADYIDAMRTVYPNGPYYLAGMCAGTLVALEMAQRLRVEDDSVSTLILIDPPMMPIAVESQYSLAALYKMRNARRHRPHVAAAIWLIMILRRLGWLSGPKDPDKNKILDRLLDGIVAERSDLEEERYLNRFARRESHGDFQFQAQAVKKVVLALRKAWQEYVPQFYDKHVHVVASARRAPFFEHPDYFWHSVLPKKSIHIVSEKHAGIMRNDGALTGREIQAAIDLAEAQTEDRHQAAEKFAAE